MNSRKILSILHMVTVADPVATVNFLRSPPADWRTRLEDETTEHIDIPQEAGFVVHREGSVPNELTADVGVVVFGSVAVSLGEGIAVLAPVGERKNFTPYIVRVGVAIIPDENMLTEFRDTLARADYVPADSLPKTLYLLTAQGIFQSCAQMLEQMKQRRPQIVTPGGMTPQLHIPRG